MCSSDLWFAKVLGNRIKAVLKNSESISLCAKCCTVLLAGRLIIEGLGNGDII